MDLNRYFYERKFATSFSNFVHRFVYEIFFKKADPEIPDIDSLKKPVTDKKILTVYISGRKSRIEQFLLGGFMIKNGITPPTHSLGPKTIFFRQHREIWIIFLSFLRKKIIREKYIDSLYIPVDSPEELAIDPAFIKMFHKIKHREVRIVPVITLWNKNLDQKNRWSWIQQYVGQYNFWSTSWELLMLVIKRRKLTLRIGIPVVGIIESSPEIFIKKLYKIMIESRQSVVGVSLKNWLDLKNDALLELDLKTNLERKESLSIINSMGTKYSPSIAEFYTHITGKILRTIFSKFYYSSEEIQHLRKICNMSGANMIFVPTHKSYFDYLILNYLLYNEKVTVPLVAAGDNLDFFPLSRMLRTMGAFFIRRAIKDDIFYKEILRSYLKHIITAGYNMEFFIEGGRSRSGMVRSPRTGMLKMLAEIGRITNRKLYIIPVSITYEKLKEIEEYKKEKSGIKSPESDNFFQKVANLIKVNYGPVYIRFSRPIYLSSKFTVETAFRITEAQEKLTVISFSSLFSTIFLCFKELSSKEIVERMEFCVKELKKLPFVLTANALENLDVNCSKLSKKLVKKGDIVLVSPQKDKFSLSINAVTEFSFYKNSIAFAFAPFFCDLFKNSEKFSFINEYLETVIMGYNRSLNPTGEIDVEKSPVWFKELLTRFFLERFVLFKKCLEIFKTATNLLLKDTSHSEIVQKLLPVLSVEISSLTSDEIFEVIFFLEKKLVLTNNLEELDNNLADKFILEANEIVDFLSGEKFE